MRLYTFIGASNSSKIGCWMKISLAFVHRYLISYSSNWTCLPGLFPRTASNLSTTSSRSMSWSVILVGGDVGYWVINNWKEGEWKKKSGFIGCLDVTLSLDFILSVFILQILERGDTSCT